MASQLRLHLSLIIKVLLVNVYLITTHAVNALNIEYCSNLNTGSGFSQVNNIYQSNGACYQTCDASWAFAIVQGSSCWCSNYAPGVTTSGGDCNQNCPGFPSDQCGSSEAGLFGYISLDKSVSGTVGGSSSTSSPAVSPQPEVKSTTLISTTTIAPSSSSSSSSSSTSWSPTPVTTVQTVTGQVQTITITPTQPPTPTAASVVPTQYHKSSGLARGAIAGLVVGLLVAFAMFGVFVIFCLRYRRDSAKSLASGDGSSGSNGSRSPPQSRNSMHALIGAIQEKQPSNRPGIRLWPDARGKTTPTEVPENFMPVARTPSNPRLVDQRLDPGTLWNAEHDNSSRVSVRSLRDDRDYSRRVLKLTNPDDGSTHPT